MVKINIYGVNKRKSNKDNDQIELKQINSLSGNSIDELNSD